MNLNFPHYIFPTNSGLIVLKFPEEKGRVLFALRTNLDKLHFWLAHSKAGTVVEVETSGENEIFIVVLYQYDGGQYSKIYKPNFSKQEGNILLFECERTEVTVANKQFEKTYTNRLIVEMAADHAALREAFLEASQEVEKESKIVVNTQPKLIIN